MRVEGRTTAFDYSSKKHRGPLLRILHAKDVVYSCFYFEEGSFILKTLYVLLFIDNTFTVVQQSLRMSVVFPGVYLQSLKCLFYTR